MMQQYGHTREAQKSAQSSGRQAVREATRHWLWLVASPDALLSVEAVCATHGVSYNCGPGVSGGILLGGFSAEPRMEDTLGRWLMRIALLQRSISVSLNNFGGLPEHTIYWRILAPQALRPLWHELRRLDPYLTTNGLEPLSPAGRLLLPVQTGLKPATYRRMLAGLSQAEARLDIQMNRLAWMTETPGGRSQLQWFHLGNPMF